MIPSSIEFQGGVIFQPEQFIRPRRITGPIPAAWPRIRFEGGQHTLPALDRWLADSMTGRWSSYAFSVGPQAFLVVAFESLQDAVMFRLKGGETAYLEA